MTKQVITLVSFVIAACTITNVYLIKNRLTLDLARAPYSQTNR